MIRLKDICFQEHSPFSSPVKRGVFAVADGVSSKVLTNYEKKQHKVDKFL